LVGNADGAAEGEAVGVRVGEAVGDDVGVSASKDPHQMSEVVPMELAFVTVKLGPLPRRATGDSKKPHKWITPGETATLCITSCPTPAMTKPPLRRPSAVPRVHKKPSPVELSLTKPPYICPKGRFGDATKPTAWIRLLVVSTAKPRTRFVLAAIPKGVTHIGLPFCAERRATNGCGLA